MITNLTNTSGDNRGKVAWPGKKILIVEDEPANREYLNILLTRTNATLMFAENGLQMRLKLSELDAIDLVLLDVRLPDASGWDLALEIKAIRRDLPVIIQTAFAMASDRQKSEEVGCDGFISKPINRALLFNLMDRLLTLDNVQNK